jgi:hypothetical protein
MAPRTAPDATVTELPPREVRHGSRTHPLDGMPSRRALGRTVTRTNRMINAAVGTLADAATSGARAATRRLTEEPAHSTDDWGRDATLVRNMMLLANLRWDVSTGGDQRLPSKAGALVVVNSPQFSASPVFAAFAISEAIDRPVRFVGRSDTDLRGSLSRRIGGLLDHPDELAGALRSKQVVVMAAGAAVGTRRVGPVDHTLVAAALATGTRVFPAAASSTPFARHARLEIGEATRPPRKRRGPLAELEMAEQLRTDIARLLEEMGDISTGTPLDWLPLSGIGAH